MAKQDIKRLLDQASSALESENDSQLDSIRSDLKHFKTKTLDKISKSTP
ncbi:hypothetical protein [Candidatus Nitrosotenuis aquarius]|nr:hypothetical protein [Candidatus Nitrosotenuis aquarius]